MLNNYIALVTAHWYCEYDDTTNEAHFVLTNIKNYSEAMEQIEEYFKTDLQDVSITLLTGPFLEVNGDTLEKIAKDEV